MAVTAGKPEGPSWHLDRWARLWDSRPQLVQALSAGSAIGLVPQETLGANEGHQMLVWETTDGGYRASCRPFPGFRAAGVHILFVASAAALSRLSEAADGREFSEFKDLLRKGQVLFFILCPHAELEARGFGQLVEELGLPFLGGCY